ncbi:MAG: DNA-directed RNA polymerase subunit beta', partial [Microvirga sp.]
SQDMVLGLYYLSLEKENEPGEGMLLSDMAEVHQALAAGAVTLHTKIVSRVPQTDEQGNTYMKRFETTAGRMLLGETLPKSHKVPFETVNKVLTKKEIGDVIDIVYRHTGQKETVLFADAIMQLGFRHAFAAGISFGKDDMVIPKEKEKLVEETRALVKDYEQQYQDGLITQQEKYNKVIDAWSRCGDQVATAMMKEISATPKLANGRQADLNSIYMMAHSGARGSQAQIKQLAGMRGLMAKPSGEIIETPIISNFKEGLTVLEYFNSTHGARKGLADTALRTADSGYLTRRLVDVAQDVITRDDDCGTEEGSWITREDSTDEKEFRRRLVGRLAAAPLPDASVKVKKGVEPPLLVDRNVEISEEIAVRIEAAGIAEVLVRSPLTCEARYGVCRACYGRNLATGEMVASGEAVGIIAAQSIGEPGTQLTMRTFHIGGAAQIADQSFIESNFEGTVRMRNRNVARNSEGELIVMGRNVAVVIVGQDGVERAVHRLQYGARLKVDEGDHVKRGQRIAEWDPYTRPILTEVDGAVAYEDLVDGQSMTETTDESTGIAKRVVIDWRGSSRTSDLRPAMVIHDKGHKIAKLGRGGEARWLLPVDAIVAADPGAKVKAGDVLARISTESAKTRDITGGLPRVAELFEARRPKDAAIIAEKSGTIQFGRDYKNKRRLTLTPHDGSEAVEYLIPKGKHIHLQDGDVVEVGDFIVDGNPAPHDILAIKGVEELAAYLVNEIQEVYRLQGVSINDKHIEVIVRQMLQKAEITDGGDSELLAGEQLDRLELDEINERLAAEGKKPATGVPVLLGITKASLQTRSFISAASFQETTRVLTEAAVNGKVDNLEGLKENVIVGSLIPAGTGAMVTDIRSVAQRRDDMILAQKAAEAQLQQAQAELPSAAE